MKTAVRLICFFLVMAAASAPAQRSGSHRGLLIGLDLFGGSPHNILLHLDSKNVPTTFFTGSNTPWPHWSRPHGMVMDVDNQMVLVPVYLDIFRQKLAMVRWDPGLPGVVGTLWTCPRGSPLSEWVNWTLDSDGNPVTIDNAAAFPHILTVFDRFSGVWRTNNLGTGGDGWGGLTWDRASGGYLSAGVNPMRRLYRTDYSGKITSPVAWLGSPPGWGGDLAGNGDWISAATNNATYDLVKAGSSSFTSVNLGQIGWLDDVTHEKWAAPGDRFYATQKTYSSSPYPGSVFLIDPMTTPPSVITVWSGGPPNRPADSLAMEILPLHERDLTTLRTGKATWSLAIHPGNAALSGKAYVVAASLAGARPPVRLKDGREFFLVPDALTLATVSGPFWPFFTGNTGYLGVGGRSVAMLDFSSVGCAANGVVVHFCGVVLDPASPLGIAWVLDPWAFVVNVMP